MSLRTQYEFLFIGRDEGSFVENYAYDLGESGERSGKVFINLEIQNNPAEAEMIGETIFDTVRKAFFADLEKDAYTRFEDALKDVNDALNAMREEKVSQYIGNLHVLIVAIVDDNLYLTQCGDSEAYLVRRRFCSIVSEGLADPHSKDFFTNIASGVLEPGDFVLLSSTRLLRYIAKTDLSRIASGQNLVSVLGELKDFLSTEVLGRIGFIALKAQGDALQLPLRDQGRVLAHMEKEEEYQNAGIEERKVTTVTVTDVGRKVSAFFARAKDQVQSLRNQSSQDRSRRMGSGFGEYWTRDRILVVSIVILVVLAGGIWWNSKRNAEEELINKYTATLTQAQQQISIAETTALNNPERAGKILNDAETAVKEVYNARYERNKAGQLLADIQTMRDTIDGVVRVQPTVLADLSKKRANVSTTGLLGVKDTLYAFEYNALYPILLDKVQDPVPMTIDDTEEVQMGTVSDDKGTLLFYTKAGKMIEFKDNHTSFLKTTEDTFHKAVAISAYGSRVYFLDPESNQIWKYVRRREGFDSSDKYNVEGDLKKAVAFAIDGHIYVLNSDGSILKFLSGKLQDLSIKKGPVKPLAAPTKIFTQLDMTKLYVLEPSQHRVLVYAKDDNGDLTYLSQIAFDNINDVRDFWVSKDGKSLFLMDQSKVYRVAL